MTDEQHPLSLADLAEVDSPEVVRAALSTFRKRLIIRTVLLPLAIAGLFGIPRLLPGASPSLLYQFRMSRAWQDINAPLARRPVHVVVLDARRLTHDAKYGIRFIASTDALRQDERLVVEPGITGLHSCVVASRREPSGAPGDPVWTSSQGTRDVIETVAICPIGTEQFTLEIGAFSGEESALPFGPPGGGPGEPDTAEPLGPGMHTQQECAVPLNENDVCTLPKSQGTYRVLLTVTFDAGTLRIEDRIARGER